MNVQVFIPRAYQESPLQPFGYIERDLSMPEKDWSKYERPATERRTAKVIRMQRRDMPAFLKRQA